MAFDELLAGRVRSCLQQVAGVSEKKMFGGLAFLIGGHLTVGVYGDGLIARIGAQDMDAATAQPGVRPFDMTGRPMRGIVVIDSAVLDDEALDRWIGKARGYVAGLPPKQPGSPAAAARSCHPPRLIDARNAELGVRCTSRGEYPYEHGRTAVDADRAPFTGLGTGTCLVARSASAGRQDNAP